MSSNLVHIALLFLAGCAGMNTKADGTKMTATEIAAQAEGVAKALENLPKAPGDANTKAQIENYAAWGAFLAKTAAVVIGAGS